MNADPALAARYPPTSPATSVVTSHKLQCLLSRPVESSRPPLYVLVRVPVLGEDDAALEPGALRQGSCVGTVAIHGVSSWTCYSGGL